MKYKKIITYFTTTCIILNQSAPLLVFANNISEFNSNNYEILSNNYAFDLEQYPDNIVTIITQCLDLLNEYEKTKDKDTLYECFLLFTKIPTEIKDVDLNFEEGDVFDYIFFTTRNNIYNISNIDLQNVAITYFGECIFTGWRKNKTVTIFKEKYLISELVDFNINKNILSQPRLEYLKFLCEYLEKNPDSNDTNLDDIPEIETNPPSDDEGTLIPPVGDDSNNSNEGSDNSSNNSNDSNSDSNNIFNEENGYFTEYIKKGNSCVEVKTFFKNGIPVSSQELSVSKMEYVKCGIYDYIHSDLSNNYNNIIVDKDYIENDQNIFSKYTIHYTINKNSKNTYYFNTGIRTTVSDNSITYNQLKDTLYQVAIKCDGNFIVDNQKALFISEGKPIVIKDSKDDYSKIKVEQLLNSFSKVGLKIMEHSDKKTSTLEDSLINKKIDSIQLNDDEFDLSSPFILIENQLFGPIQEITVLLGAKISLDDNKLNITKDSTNIVLNINSKEYSINNEEKLFVSQPIIYNSSVYSEVENIVSTLGYELTWDSEFEKIIINKK